MTNTRCRKFKTPAVGKSKSSNVAISAKAENKKNKKSLSNAQLQPLVVKKRGVYVEKKIQSSTDTQEANDTKIQTKAPRRPRPGQKKFLASVLTILSKSTTGTQYPDIQENKKEKARFTPKFKSTNDSESKYKQVTNKTKKTKYRSRVLNDEMLKSEKEQLIILQPKMEITQTPSSNSFRVKTASDVTKPIEENEPKQSAIRNILENNIYSGVAEGITKEVLEGKPKKEKIFRINDDPETIASEIAEKDDRHMYNFFVDLLETTISVYNVKTEYEISDVSKSAFELDDSVIQKLEIKKEHSSLHHSVNYTSKCECKHVLKKGSSPIDIKSSDDTPSPTVKPKIKVKSCLNPKSITYTRKAKTAPKSKSFDNNKGYIRKPNKKQILNDLKQELAKDTYTFHEPKSLYDALIVMAKNKSRNEKSLHFVSKIDNRMDSKDSCMFERRKVISFGMRKNYNQTRKQLPTSESRNCKKAEDFGKKRYVPSSHSLEVYGYDYEEPAKVLEEKREKRIIFNYHSSPSTSEFLVDYNL
ncbi:uncharacterized protein LOC123879688 [Maniola jurtina]|uniref:uncharacterized protein LOC123879688 n=1 Tax=Maniola jurtina TaxID=191418 RepID=UPI001E68820D|nr:uncharacterized protein LOC123879688 [Maniola jurtina]